MSRKSTQNKYQIDDLLDELGLRDNIYHDIIGYDAMLKKMREVIDRKYSQEDLDQIQIIINKNNSLLQKLTKLRQIDEDIVEASKSLDKQKRDELLIALMRLQLHTLVNLFIKVKEKCPACPKVGETIQTNFLPLIDKLIEKYKSTADLAETGHLEYGQGESSSQSVNQSTNQSPGNEREFMQAFNQVYSSMEGTNRRELSPQRGGALYTPDNQNEALAMMYLLLNYANNNQSAKNALLADKRKAVRNLAENLEKTANGTHSKLKNKIRDNNQFNYVMDQARRKLGNIISSNLTGGSFDQKYLKYKSKYLQNLNQIPCGKIKFEIN